MRSNCNVSNDSATLRHDLFASGTRVPDVMRAPYLGPVVHRASSASTSALPLAIAARNLRFSFSPTDKARLHSIRRTSLWTRWVEARPHQRRASGMPFPQGIGSRCTEARVDWQPRKVREREDLCTNTEKDQSLVKLLEEPAGRWRVTRLGGQHCREGQCWSDEVLLHQVREWRNSDTDDKKKSVCLLSRHLGQKHSNEMFLWRNGPCTSSRARSRL